MNIELKQVNGFEVQLRASISKEELVQRTDIHLMEMGKRVRIPGFRQGKIPPLSVLRMSSGPQAQEEAIEYFKATAAETILYNQDAQLKKDILTALYPQKKEVQQLDLAFSGQPEIKNIQNTQDGGVSFELVFQSLPEVEEVNIDSLEVVRYQPIIQDSQIEESLNKLAEKHYRAETLKKKRPAQINDMVVIDFEGFYQKKRVPEACAENFELRLGSQTMLPGFEEALLNTEIGQTVTFRLPFPKNYRALKLAGKTLSFNVTVKDIKAPVPVSVDEQLAKDLGFENLEALKERLKSRLQMEFDQLSDAVLRKSILDHLSEKCQFALPPKTIQEEFDAIWGHVEAEETKDKSPQDIEETRKEYYAVAERRARLALVLAKIAKAQGVHVTQEDMTAALQKQMEANPQAAQLIVNNFRRYPHLRNQLRAEIYEDKIMDLIIKKAKILAQDIPAPELEEKL